MKAAIRASLGAAAAHRVISGLAEQVRMGAATPIHETTGGMNPERDVMEWYHQLSDFLDATAPPSAGVGAFRRQSADLRNRYPSRWVVYTDGWDEGTGESLFEVLSTFDCERHAVEWTLTLSDDERAGVTVLFVEPDGDASELSNPPVFTSDPDA